MIVAAAIPAGSVPRERVRDASYLSPIDPLGSKVCTLLYDVLRAENRALAVRWTKRTNQALGIIVASSRHKALMLLELEWSANMTAPSKRVQQATQAQVSEGELDAATKFVQALSRPASALDELEDERAVLNARLLEAAREGTDEPDLTVDRPDAGELEVLLAGGGS
jgi:non-homologous end joining protein Ku